MQSVGPITGSGDENRVSATDDFCVAAPVDHEWTLGSVYELWRSLVEVKGVFFDHH